MKRRHLFEFEDLRWFPSFLRNYITDFLQFMSNQFDFYRGVVPLIEKGVAASGTNQIIDLASGGGGAWLKLSQHLQAAMPEAQIHLTDYYPNQHAFQRTLEQGGAGFSFESQSVNALDVPAYLKGLRTQFLSFHHFKPEEAQRILQNAVDARMPIAIFEAQERTFSNLVQFMFSPLGVLFTAPFIKPFKWGRLLFTYLIPLVPLFVFWDGLVSVLRTYSLEEMQTMTNQLIQGESYSWEIGKDTSGQAPVLYLLGLPK